MTMKTKTIFKALALAMMMPAMMLPTACSNDNDVIVTPENDKEGYALPVTINVTRGGDATTRATYDEGTKTLSFSSGDQLFVKGTDGTAGEFAGTLTWVSEGTFTGTIYTQYEYTGTADALLGSASTATATLLPDGYGSIGYLTVSGDGYSATLATDATKAFATSKADGVAQLSLEQASTYSNGFALAPQNAILNFTAVTGQWGSAPASSSVSLQAGETSISGSVAPVEGDYERALANFAIAVAGSASPSSLTLTVDGTSVSLGSHTLTAGKIYNQKCANINAISPMIGENEKWLVYGTGAPSGWTLTIAEGATVTLSNVNLNNYATITYLGNNTIILADGTTNTIDPGSGVAINGSMAGDKTLTIKGTGTLIATGGYYAPAIGIESGSCGAITIESTVHLTATAGTGQSKAITTGTGGGTVTIGGVVYDGGADSPFVYPAPVSLIVNPAVGQVIGNDGKNYADAAAATDAGHPAVAKIFYVGSDNGEAAPYNHGLALALSDANDGTPCTWNTSFTDAGHTKQGSSSFTSESGLQYNDTHNSDAYPAFKAAITYSPAAPTGCSSWFLPSGYQWQKMIDATGLTNLGLTSSAFYWSSSEYIAENAWDFNSEGIWYHSEKSYGDQVRACLAF